jgi:hypothetical protein
MTEPYDILEKAYGSDIAANVIDSYKEIEQNFVIQKWKTSELDAGHFVESVRRLIEFELYGSYTPFSQKLSTFTDDVLKKYENASGNDSYKILIPRMLKSIYNIRNKRGVGHISTISPNEMDATVIMQSVKWVLAELVRINSALTITETQKLIASIVERQIDLIWKDNGITRILNTELKTEEKIIILLLDESPQTEQQLLKSSNYSNSTKFRNFLKMLHKQALINYENGKCTISPTGLIEAEKTIIKIKFKKI